MITLTITGYSSEPKYPVVELLGAIEDALEDLERFTQPLNGDTPEPFLETYHTDYGQLTLKLDVIQMEPV